MGAMGEEEKGKYVRWFSASCRVEQPPSTAKNYRWALKRDPPITKQFIFDFFI